MARCADRTGRRPLLSEVSPVLETRERQGRLTLAVRREGSSRRVIQAGRRTGGFASAGRLSRSCGLPSDGVRPSRSRDPVRGASRPYSNTMIIGSCVSPTSIRPGSPARGVPAVRHGGAQNGTARLPQPSPDVIPPAPDGGPDCSGTARKRAASGDGFGSLAVLPETGLTGTILADSPGD